MTDHWVYIFHNAVGQVLYVGITDVGVSRFEAHRRSTTWGREVSYVHVEHWESREAALRRERELIETLHPAHNIRMAVADLPDGLWNEDQFATYMRITVPTARRWVDRGHVPDYVWARTEIGGREQLVFDSTQVGRWIEASTVRPA